MRRAVLLAAGLALLFAAVTLLALEGREVVVLRTTTPTGATRTTRTWIADAEGAAWIEVANPARPFLADVRAQPRLELYRDGGWTPCRATVVEPPDGHLRIRALLAAKYGWADRWIGHLTDTSASLALRLACGNTDAGDANSKSGDGARLFATYCAGCHTATGAGTGNAPDIRCATRVPDAVRKGRDTAMPAFTQLTDPDIAAIEAHLISTCASAGRTPALVYAANCAVCHGADGSGGRDARWIEGPDIRCTEPTDWTHAVGDGQGGMPPYPRIKPKLRDALRSYVRGHDCPDPSHP